MNISVLGAGSWGIALSNLLAGNGHSVTLWARRKEEAERLNKERESRSKLPGILIDNKIEIVSDASDSLKKADIILLTLPSAAVREAIELHKPYINSDSLIINTSKGFERVTLLPMTEVIRQVLPESKIAVLSGPSHAEEVAQGIPTAILAASEDEDTVIAVQNAFMNDTFRVYGCSDTLGVEIGGAVKNVIALAAGILDGVGCGDNTKAALMTRGLAEICRLGRAMGANQATFYGLSGIGDLIVTCTSMNSRNRRAGILIGKGKTMKEALGEVNMVVEGVYAAEAVMELARRYQIQMPITEAVYGVLYKGKCPKDAIMRLMSREKKFED
jgi:glycerol-3-phosphate dehydrogenase (NAD(P)+)